MTVKENPENSRALILEKARQLFLEKGYHKVTMRAIAKAAGISTGPLYFHFQNKTEVFMEICIEGMERLQKAYKQQAVQEKPVHIRLREIYRAHQRFYHEERQYYELINLAINPIAGIDISAEQKQKLLQKQLEILKIKEELIAAGIMTGEIRAINPKHFSLFLEAVSQGIFRENDCGILSQAGLGLDEMIDAAIDIVGFSLIQNR